MSSEVIGASLTIAAVAISAYNTVLFIRQSHLIEKQALLQRSQVYPFIRLLEEKVTQNKFSFQLENMSESPAYEIGLSMSFILLDGNDGKSWKFHEKPLPFTLLEDETKKDGMTEGNPIDSVVFLRNEKGLSRLYGKQRETFSAEPIFLFKNIKKIKEGTIQRYDVYSTVKKRLLNNKIRFVAISISLVYKDVAETIQESEPIKCFVIALKKHNSLEEAYHENIPFHQMAISVDNLPYTDLKSYESGKSYRGFLEPFKF